LEFLDLPLPGRNQADFSNRVVLAAALWRAMKDAGSFGV